MKHFLVAIDGPAGAGKSTVARLVAQRLGLTYVDTGAMYRAIAYKALRDRVNVKDEDAVTQMAESTTISLEPNGIWLDGVQLKDEIRTPEVSALASEIAKMPGIRKVLVNIQQEFAQTQSVVMDGRDIGTYVLPHADVKFFLTASIEERAQRRFKELLSKGISADINTLQKEIRQRDENDRTRVHAPLRQAEDAILLDTTHQSIEEAVNEILQICRNKMGGEE